MATPMTKDDSRRMRSTTAFMVETLVLLIVLAASIAVFTQLFSRATAAADQSARLCQAVDIAEDAAEEFSADPAAVAASSKVGNGVAISGHDNYKVSCKITQDKQGVGTLWAAHITVSDAQGKIYALDTSRYVSEVK